VRQVIIGPGFARDEAGSAGKGRVAEPVSAGDAVAVRQDPSSRPLLEKGKEYALWLTPTMLDGDAANDFFITGSNAGMYLVDGDIARRVATETGDNLPETIEIAGRP
jgi:hypothetical protein